ILARGTAGGRETEAGAELSRNQRMIVESALPIWVHLYATIKMRDRRFWALSIVARITNIWEGGALRTVSSCTRRDLLQNDALTLPFCQFDPSQAPTAVQKPAVIQLI